MHTHCEATLAGDSVEELSSSCQFESEIVGVSRFEPLEEFDNVWMVKSLEHIHLVENRLLISLRLLLGDDFHGYVLFAVGVILPLCPNDLHCIRPEDTQDLLYTLPKAPSPSYR